MTSGLPSRTASRMTSEVTSTEASRANRRQFDIRVYAVIASLLISLVIFLFPEAHTPNDDAYTYIRTAEIFLTDGLAAAFQYYPWASYAVLIGLTSNLGLDLFSAAQLINAVFFALLVFSFISIVREMHTSRLILLLAATVILLYPQLNEYRAYVIRDIGFWALALLALWLFLLYARTGLLQYAIGFCATLLLATTLRPEALLYLLVIPFALLFDPRFERQVCQRRFLLLASLVAGIGLFAPIALTLGGVNVISLLIEFVSVYQPFFVNTFAPEPAQALAVGDVLFGEHAAAYSREYIPMFMAAGLFTILLANLFNGIGGPFFWVLVYGAFQKQLRITRAVALPVFLFMLTNAVVLLGFLFVTRYLTSRYAILFSLMLALLIPQLLAYYLENKSAPRRRIARVVLGIFLAYCAIDAYITFGDRKRYVFDAIEWVAQNADDGALLTNNHAVAYRSGKVENYDKIERNLTATDILQTTPGDLVVIEMNFPMEKLLDSPGLAGVLERVVAFTDDEEERLLILRRVTP